ncbi:MAG TPA: hypothetical protein VJP88_02655, partial [Caulobacteraceae bacterium]|nr:hypothetical protein [Caulobacteraceae bacterium]
MTTTLLAMSSALPGREKDYADWYVSQHLGDMRRVPGVVSGSFYGRVDSDAKTRWAHCGFYDLDRPLDDVLAEVGRRVGGAEMPLTDATDRERVAFLSLARSGPRLTFGDFAGPVALHLVMATPLAGRDEDVAAWSSEFLQGVPGCVAAQRFDLAPE